MHWQYHGNPQYFITFTCNFKWPEIVRYMDRFHALKAEDRPVVIARVFHMKLLFFTKFLKTQKPFGKVLAGHLFITYQITLMLQLRPTFPFSKTNFLFW